MLGLFIVMISMVMVACGGDTTKKDNNAEPNNKEANSNKEANNNEDAANNEEAANNEGNANAGEEVDAAAGFEDLIAYLKAMDLEPGEPMDQDPAVAASLGAEKGIILPIADIDVQFFIYDKDGDSFNQEQYDEAQSEGTVTFDAGEPFTIPMLMNGDLGLANYENHYMKDELVEAFKNF